MVILSSCASINVKTFHVSVEAATRIKVLFCVEELKFSEKNGHDKLGQVCSWPLKSIVVNRCFRKRE